MMAEAESKPWHSEIHAEEIETSMMLAIAPELVRMDLAEADYPPVPGRLRAIGTVDGPSDAKRRLRRPAPRRPPRRGGAGSTSPPNVRRSSGSDSLKRHELLRWRLTMTE